MALKLEKTPKDWQTEVIISIYKKDDHSSERITEEYHFIAFQERCMPSVLKVNTEN